ncbi:hypothetical protein PQO03_20735 [Lentisphaera profundi]|uniref:WD40 repeat domain-containing protein n=1 Tax=Lentisphaera profundi TaxID=1658616 RepID=A0ABY7VZN5_9BACT|nr:hypothetical protein [Lentisphaera profundi]WDE98246.1 hypothetical protein PQO03_20735 [Lentisphaera profundi]
MYKKLIWGTFFCSSFIVAADEHGNRNGEVSFDKSGEEYLVAGRDFVLLDKNGTEKKLLNRNGYTITTAKFSSDDSYIVALEGQTKQLKVLDKNGVEKASLRLNYAISSSVELHVTGYDSTIALSSNKQIYFYEYRDGKIVKRAELPFPDSTFINAYDISKDGKYIFVNDRRFIILKSPKTWIFKPAKSFVKVTGKIRKVRIAEDGSKVMVLHQNGRGVSLHNANTGDLIQSYMLTSAINEIECDDKLSKAYFNGGNLNLDTGRSEVSRKFPVGKMNMSADSSAYSVGSLIKRSNKVMDVKAPYQLFSTAKFTGDVLRVNELDKSYEINIETKSVSKVASKSFATGRFQGLVGQSSDGRYGVDASGRLYDYRQKAFVGRPLFGTGGFALAADISANGDIAFVASNKVYIYNYISKKSVKNFDLPVTLNSESQINVVLSPGSAHCAISYVDADASTEVLVYNLKSSRFSSLSRKVTAAKSLLFVSDDSLVIAGGKAILTTEYNGNKWVVNDSKSLLIESGALYKVVIDGNNVAGLNENGRIHLFDYLSGREVYTVALKDGKTSMRAVGK